MRIGRLLMTCVVTAVPYAIACAQVVAAPASDTPVTPAPIDQPVGPGLLSTCKVVDTVKAGIQADLLLSCPTSFRHRIGEADSYQSAFHAVSGSLLVARKLGNRLIVELISVTPGNRLHVDDLRTELGILSGGPRGHAAPGTEVDLNAFAASGKLTVSVPASKDRPAVAPKLLDVTGLAAAATKASPPLVGYTPAPKVVSSQGSKMSITAPGA